MVLYVYFLLETSDYCKDMTLYPYSILLIMVPSARMRSVIRTKEP